MNIKYLLAAATALVAAPAMAQDAGAAANFAGPRVEARMGWAQVGYEASIDGETGKQNEQSVTFGGEVGYDMPVGTNFIVGAYAGADFGSAETCEEIFGLDEACIDARRNITLGARAGVPVGQNFMLYGKAGYSNTRFRATYVDFEGILDDERASSSIDGVHVGGGFELAAGPNVYVKAEYTYTMYGDADETIEGFDINADIDRHQGLVGVGFRF